MTYTKKQVRDKIVQLIDDEYYEDACFLMAEALDIDWSDDTKTFDHEVNILLGHEDRQTSP